MTRWEEQIKLHICQICRVCKLLFWVMHNRWSLTMRSRHPWGSAPKISWLSIDWKHNTQWVWHSGDWMVHSQKDEYGVTDKWADKHDIIFFRT